MSVCQQWTFNDSPWLKSCWFQTVSVFVDGRLLGSQCCLSTGLVENDIRLTKRCNALSSWSDVFHIVALCVFSHQSADYSIVVAHLTSNSFEGHPCCMHTDYLPTLCFWYSSLYHAYWEWIHFFKTPDLNTEFWVMRERHGSLEWLVDIRHNGHTCVSTSFYWNIVLAIINITI